MRRFSPPIVESLREWLEAQSRCPSYAGSNPRFAVADLQSHRCRGVAIVQAER